MAYSTNPNLPKARAVAMQLLVRDCVPVQVVANKCGVNRSTIWRWKQRWNALNKDIQLTNVNRPSRPAGSSFRLAACTWRIPTYSSRPHHHPWTLPEATIQLVLAARENLKRCAEVVWWHLTHGSDETGSVRISLSSVRRILRRHHCFDGARKPRLRRDNPRRPLVTAPGELVETDTIHYICPHTGRRWYVYTVIDLYSRMAYAAIYPRILPGLAAETVLEAQARFGFSFRLVQGDNGPEFSRYFEQRMRQSGVAVRHTRLHRPNDNAHVERFNRTIQEECLGHSMTYKMTRTIVQARLTAYLDYYNTKRVHLGIHFRTPSQMLQRF